MSEATARPWGWSRDQEGDIVIHGPPDPETSEIVLVDGVFLSDEEAALIVKAVNRDDTFDRLVEALRELAPRYHAAMAGTLGGDAPPSFADCDKTRCSNARKAIEQAAGSVLPARATERESRDSRNGEAGR